MLVKITRLSLKSENVEFDTFVYLKKLIFMMYVYTVLFFYLNIQGGPVLSVNN